MDTDIDVDQVLISLKPWGKWQVQQITWQMMLCFPAAFQLLATILLAYSPYFRCISNNAFITDQTNLTEVAYMNTCEIIDLSTNLTTPCDRGFIYDTPKERSIISEWDLFCDRQYLSDLSQTMFTVGQGIGATLFMYLADRYGRKSTCLISLGISMLVGVVAAFVPNIYGFIVLRLLIGIFQQGYIMVVSVLTLELVPVQQRTYMSLWGNLNWALAMTVFSLLGYLCRDLNWRTIQLILTAPCVLLIANLLVVDESIRWLHANGKYKAMRKIIRKAAKMNERCDNELVKSFISDDNPRVIQLKHVKQKANLETHLDCGDQPLVQSVVSSSPPASTEAQYSPLEIIRHSKLRLFMAIMFFTWMVNSLVYLGLLFTSSALAGNTYLNLFLNTVVGLPAGFVCYAMLKWVGRRLTCVIFHALAGVALITAVIIQIISGSSRGPVITACSIIGKFGISTSFGAIFMYTPELFPTNLRSLGLGIAATAARVGGMAAPFANFLIKINPWAPGAIYGAGLFVCCFLMFLLPETKDTVLPETLEEIDAWFQKPSSEKSNGTDTRNLRQHPFNQ